MSTVKTTAAAMFAVGRAAAADWLSENHQREKPISLAKCRAIRLTDMVLQYEALPQFDALLASWEEGFDSTARQHLAAHGKDRLGKNNETVAGTGADDPAQATSCFEERFEYFSDELQRAHGRAAPLMRELNRVATITAGLGVVLRIVAGNVVVQDNFNPGDPAESAPLSPAAVSSLTSMAAAMCEQLNDNVVARADWFNSRVHP